MPALLPYISARLAKHANTKTKASKKWAKDEIDADDDLLSIARRRTIRRSEAATGSAGPVNKISEFVLTFEGINKHSDDLFIVFRNSKKFVDWVSNFKICHSTKNIQGTDYSVHRGFSDIMECVWPALAYEIEKSRPKTIHCIGHSLGGAVANICALYTRLHFPNPTVYLYTFASPKVGCLNFATSLSNLMNENGRHKIFRVIHSSDIAMDLPPTGNFHHASTLPKCPPIVIEKPQTKFHLHSHGINQYIDSVRGKDWNELVLGHKIFPTETHNYLFKQHNPHYLHALYKSILKKCSHIGVSPRSHISKLSFWNIQEDATIFEAAHFWSYNSTNTKLGKDIDILMQSIGQLVGIKYLNTNRNPGANMRDICEAFHQYFVNHLGYSE